MKKLIEMPLEGESNVLVAVDVPEELSKDDLTNVGVLEFLFGPPEKVEKKFNTVTEMIVKCSRPIVNSFKQLKEEKMAPKKATAEFGLSFNTKGSIYLVETSMEGSIKVSIEWDLDSDT